MSTVEVLWEKFRKKEIELAEGISAVEVLREYKEIKYTEVYLSKKTCRAGDPLIVVSLSESSYEEEYQSLLSSFKFNH